MSTRCQIEFKEITKYYGKKKSIIERRTIYRHSDGYPNGEYGVIENIREFLNWDKGFDIEFTPANFIYWNKTHTIKHLTTSTELKHLTSKEKKQEIEEITDRWSKLGFGICANDEFHCDIAYFYELINKVTEIKKRKFKTELNLLVYDVKSERTKQGFLQPKTRKNLKLIKTVKLLNKMKVY